MRSVCIIILSFVSFSFTPSHWNKTHALNDVKESTDIIIGRLMKIEAVRRSNTTLKIYAYFDVSNRFKGAKKNVKTLLAKCSIDKNGMTIGDTNPYAFAIGNNYLLFLSQKNNEFILRSGPYSCAQLSLGVNSDGSSKGVVVKFFNSSKFFPLEEVSKAIRNNTTKKFYNDIGELNFD